MKKIGMIWLGHADYLDDNAKAIMADIKYALGAIPSIEPGDGSVATTDQQAIAAARAILRENYGGAILVLTSWVECNVVMSAIKELRGLPMLLWGFPLVEVGGRTESTGSYVSAAMLSGVIRRLKLRADVLIGSWKQGDILEKIHAFAMAAATVDKLFYSKIGLFGYSSMSIYTGTFDHVLLRYLVGPEVEQLDSYSLITAAQSAPRDQVRAAIARLGTCARLQDDVQEAMLCRTMEIYVALRRYCARHGWDAVNVKCQYEFSKEYRVVPCVALSLLADDGIVASCEGDMLNTVSMLILNGLSGSTVTYGDALSHTGNTVKFSPCGFMPFSMGHQTVKVQKFMEHPGFSGIQVCGVLRPEKVTYLRLIEDVGSYHILYGTGNGLETAPRGGCMPALDVELSGSVEALCAAYAGQHFALSYGDLSAEVEAFAKLLGIPAIRI